MPDERLYDQVMQEGLQDWLDQQAAPREHARTERSKRWAITALLTVTIAVVAFALSGEPFMAVFSAVTGGIIGYYWAEAPVRAVTSAVKGEVNTRLAAALGGSFRPGVEGAFQALPGDVAPDLDPAALGWIRAGDPGAAWAVARAMGMVPPSPDEAEYTDFWTGPFRGAPMIFHEAHLQEWRGSGKDRRLETVFRGLVVAWSFARRFHGLTLIRREAGLFNAFSGPGSVAGRRLEKVRLVDPQFERLFEVVSDDQVEARYLIHPAFCERLMAVERSFEARNIRLAFFGGQVVAVMDADDQFESGGIDAARDQDNIRSVIGQIGAIIELSQTLNERARGAPSGA